MPTQASLPIPAEPSFLIRFYHGQNSKRRTIRCLKIAFRDAAAGSSIVMVNFSNPGSNPFGLMRRVAGPLFVVSRFGVAMLVRQNHFQLYR